MTPHTGFDTGFTDAERTSSILPSEWRGKSSYPTSKGSKIENHLAETREKGRQKKQFSLPSLKAPKARNESRIRSRGATRFYLAVLLSRDRWQRHRRTKPSLVELEPSFVSIAERKPRSQEFGTMPTQGKPPIAQRTIHWALARSLGFHTEAIFRIRS